MRRPLHSRSRRPRLVFALPFLLALLAAPAARAAVPRCDSTTALTLVGIDTQAQRVLLAPPATGGEAGWLIELDAASGKATAWPEAHPGARFAGSTGPGPVVVASRCGKDCLQMLQFRRGTWEPLGEPILAGGTVTVHATWDRDGVPWVVLQRGAGAVGVGADAYFLNRREWVSAGSLSIQGVGNPGALPAPPGERGITSGDGHFAAGHPERWPATMPARPAGGELLWLGGPRAAYIAEDGQLRVTDDGQAWHTVLWLPWTAGEGDLAWKPGRDWWVELPDGDRSPPLAAAWTDNRVPSKATIYLAHRTPAGDWVVDVRTPQGILTAGGERLPFNQLIRFGADHWLLITGCVGRSEGAALALREVRDGKLGDPRVVTVEAQP